jgi:hypothetical protein
LTRGAVITSILALAALAAPASDIRTVYGAAVPMRDGTVLRADVFLPGQGGPFPVLVYRTPYNKSEASVDYTMHDSAVRRGYAVVLQDVRGRHASEGTFNPYFQEGTDGYDTIEWAARQEWSNGKVGTFGLSYPGAVQWLAALEPPPHLVAMAPAMTYSTPRNFFWFDGVFDLSWQDWLHFNIAPDERRRRNLAGPRSADEISAYWNANADRMRRHVPLMTLPDFRAVAPYYHEWLAHPPHDAYWDAIEVRGRYARVSAAVLNLSGWYDEAYGPEGAVTNFNGLVEARRGVHPPRAHLLLGPWVHGVGATQTGKTGELDFGAGAAIDYDETLLRFFDHYLRGVDNGVDTAPPVRYFVMGANEWRASAQWPPAGTRPSGLFLAGGSPGRLSATPAAAAASSSRFTADPSRPVSDDYEDFGPHDYRALAMRDDLLVFDTAPFERDLEIAGNLPVEIFASCDCRDFDLWVKPLRVDAEGRAWNLVSPGADVLRASMRDSGRRELLEPGRVYPLRLGRMVVSQRFRAGERLRLQISASFFPRLSRNLQTGESEVDSDESQPAVITIHHDAEFPSRIVIPVLSSPGSAHRPARRS